jgi:hypothetical protein
MEGTKMAKLKKRIFAVPDGEIHPRWFEVGEDVSGSVEQAAKAQGALDVRKPRNKATKPPETK